MWESNAHLPVSSFLGERISYARKCSRGVTSWKPNWIAPRHQFKTDQQLSHELFTNFEESFVTRLFGCTCSSVENLIIIQKATFEEPCVSRLFGCMCSSVENLIIIQKATCLRRQFWFTFKCNQLAIVASSCFQFKVTWNALRRQLM